MSHPSGCYNNNTLKVLKKIGINIGFKSHLNDHQRDKKNINYLKISTKIENKDEFIKEIKKIV